MTEDQLLADLGLVEGEPAHDLVRAVRASYVRDELPHVSPDLAAVFSGGLGLGTTSAGPLQQAGEQRAETRRRRFRARLATITVGAAAVSVNLVGVGSAGWLPGPVQTVFDRATSSVGIEVPGSPARRDAGSPRRNDPQGPAPGRSTAGRENDVPAAVSTVPPGLGGGTPETRQAPDRSGTTHTTNRGQPQTDGSAPGRSPGPDPRPGSGAVPPSPGTGSRPCPSVPTTVSPPQLPPRSVPGARGVPPPHAGSGLADAPPTVDRGPDPCPTTTTSTTSTTRP